MVDMFSLVLPEKVSQEMVNKYVKLTYDPSNNELIQIVMPFMTASQVTTLTVDKGWVTEASVEDVKLLPGVHRVMFRLQGGDWVAREIVKDVKSENAEFVLSTGDLVCRKSVDGIPLRHAPAPPAAIPLKLDNQYFSLSKRGALWEGVAQSRMLSVFVPAEIAEPKMELLVVLE